MTVVEVVGGVVVFAMGGATAFVAGVMAEKQRVVQEINAAGAGVSASLDAEIERAKQRGSALLGRMESEVACRDRLFRAIEPVIMKRYPEKITADDLLELSAAYFALPWESREAARQAPK